MTVTNTAPLLTHTGWGEKSTFLLSQGNDMLRVIGPRVILSWLNTPPSYIVIPSKPPLNDFKSKNNNKRMLTSSLCRTNGTWSNPTLAGLRAAASGSEWSTASSCRTPHRHQVEVSLLEVKSSQEVAGVEQEAHMAQAAPGNTSITHHLLFIRFSVQLFPLSPMKRLMGCVRSQ